MEIGLDLRALVDYTLQHSSEIVTSLLKVKDWDANGRDSICRTPLI